MDGHLPSLGWSPTNPRMVTYQKEVYYIVGIWHYELTKKSKAITHQKEVYYILQAILRETMQVILCAKCN